MCRKTNPHWTENFYVLQIEYMRKTDALDYIATAEWYFAFNPFMMSYGLTQRLIQCDIAANESTRVIWLSRAIFAAPSASSQQHFELEKSINTACVLRSAAAQWASRASK